MSKYSLLSKANQINFFSKPFPHLIIENALPDDYYSLISSKFPISYFERIKNENENNVRKDLYIDQFLNEKDIDIEWKIFIFIIPQKVFLTKLYQSFQKIY